MNIDLRRCLKSGGHEVARGDRIGPELGVAKKRKTMLVRELERAGIGLEVGTELRRI
jgi:hypothetical protein